MNSIVQHLIIPNQYLLQIISSLFKPLIERLDRTFKASYRVKCGFDNLDGASYDLALWVAYYNFLRPHSPPGYRVLNRVEMLEGADNMPGKWQLLIYLGQKTNDAMLFLPMVKFNLFLSFSP